MYKTKNEMSFKEIIKIILSKVCTIVRMLNSMQWFKEENKQWGSKIVSEGIENWKLKWTSRKQ